VAYNQFQGNQICGYSEFVYACVTLELKGRTVCNIIQIRLSFLIFFFALAIRMWYVNTVEIDTPIRADAAGYVTAAQNIIVNGYFSNKWNAKKHDGFLTPGYPIFLAGLIGISDNGYDAYELILNTQAVIDAVSCVLLFLIASFFLPYYWGLLAGLIMAVYPHFVTLSGYVLTETLFMLLFLISVIFAIKAISKRSYKYFFVFGAVTSVAALVRPAIILLPIFLLLIPLIDIQATTKRLRMALFCILGIALFWSPWLMWKKVYVDEKPNQVSLFAAAFALGIYPDLVHKDPRYKGLPELDDPEAKKMALSLKYGLKVLSERAKQEPAKYLNWYLFGKPAMFWSWGILVGQGGAFIYPVKSSIYSENRIAYWSMVFSKYYHGFFNILMLFAFAFGGYLLYKRKRNFTDSELVLIPLLLTAGYFTLIHTILAPLPRYSVPFRPLTIVLALYMIMRTASFLSEQGVSKKITGIYFKRW